MKEHKHTDTVICFQSTYRGSKVR